MISFIASIGKKLLGLILYAEVLLLAALLHFDTYSTWGTVVFLVLFVLLYRKKGEIVFVWAWIVVTYIVVVDTFNEFLIGILFALAFGGVRWLVFYAKSKWF